MEWLDPVTLALTAAVLMLTWRLGVRLDRLEEATLRARSRMERSRHEIDRTIEEAIARSREVLTAEVQDLLACADPSSSKGGAAPASGEEGSVLSASELRQPEAEAVGLGALDQDGQETNSVARSDALGAVLSASSRRAGRHEAAHSERALLYEEAARRHGLPAAYLEVGGPWTEWELHASRLGGQPLALPRDGWPRCAACAGPLAFVAQIDFRESAVRLGEAERIDTFYYCGECMPTCERDAFTAGAWGCFSYRDEDLARAVLGVGAEVSSPGLLLRSRAFICLPGYADLQELAPDLARRWARLHPAAPEAEWEARIQEHRSDTDPLDVPGRRDQLGGWPWSSLGTRARRAADGNPQRCVLQLSRAASDPAPWPGQAISWSRTGGDRVEAFWVES